MKPNESEDRFSLVPCGLVASLLSRVPLIGRAQRTRELWFFSAIAWLPLLVLAGLDGTASGDSVSLPLLEDFTAYARFLVAVPLFLAVERVVSRRAAEVVEYLDTSGIVQDAQRSAWEVAVATAARRARSRRMELLLLVLAFTSSWIAVLRGMDLAVARGMTTSWFATADGGLTVAGLWFVGVSLPCYRFLAYRWVWRFLVWSVFLWRVSKIPLRLEATHPDQMGGLEVVWRSQSTFVLVGLGFAVALAGGFAHEIAYLGSSFQSEQLAIASFVFILLAGLSAPLLVFARQMSQVKERALTEFGQLGLDLAEQFRRKWVERRDTAESRMLDSADPSAVADYAAAYGAVSSMRVFPISMRGLIVVAGLLAVPFLPLVLLEFPMAAVLERLLNGIK